jgi:hypothetical protein
LQWTAEMDPQNSLKVWLEAQVTPFSFVLSLFFKKIVYLRIQKS